MAKILVIEDVDINLDLFVALLEAYGHVVSSAKDGRSGLESARNDPPDLIISDLMMDEIDGFEVARRVRADKTSRHIPMIAVSALVNGDVQRRVEDAGFDHYIAKPIQARTFVPEIEKYLPTELRSPSGTVAVN